MGAQTMLWASDATWVKDLHWTWVKDLHRSLVPVMTETIQDHALGLVKVR